MTHFLKSCEVPLARQYGLALLDLDGVVYRGAEPVENAARGISLAEGQGMTMSYTTNNASRYPSEVADQLRGFGLDVDETSIITSAIVAARMVREHLGEGARILVIGSSHLGDQVEANGMKVVRRADEKPDAVLQAWYPGLSWADLAQAAYAIEGGARYFVTNRDMTLPREGGMAPGNGSMLLPVIKATGKNPEDSAGKPESAMYDEARQILSKGPDSISRSDCLPVGDRLDTDIEAANRGGYDSLLVLTGVDTLETAARAIPVQRPTYIARDLLGLTERQPAVNRQTDGSWVCGGCRALVSDGGIRTWPCAREDCEGDGLDQARAVICAAWDYVDQGGNVGKLDFSGLDADLK